MTREPFNHRWLLAALLIGAAIDAAIIWIAMEVWQS